MAQGTLLTFDTLKSSQQTILEIGEDKVWQTIDAALTVHNTMYRDAFGDLVEITTDQTRRYGGAATMTMKKADPDQTRTNVQKVTTGSNVSFPLDEYQVAVQWSKNFIEEATGEELAAQFTAAADGDVQNALNEIKKAVFIPTNYSFNDHLVRDVTLDIKRLVNADGASIPLGPTGQVFNPATHTHYLARVSTLSAQDVMNVIETVVEHYPSGRAVLYINRAEEAAMRSFTGSATLDNFVPYLAPGLTPSLTQVTAQGTLDTNNLYNRAIGMFGATEVWVKPWMPAGYMFAFLKGAPKPICMRERRKGSSVFMLDHESESHPLYARQMKRRAGWGVWNRTNGAILYVYGTSYVAPTL